MRFSCTEYAIVSFWSLAYRTVYIIRGMRVFCTEYAVISLPVIGLSYGLQSFKGCVPLALDTQLLVQFTTIQTMHFFCTKYAIVGLPVVSLSDHLKSSKALFLLHWICNCRLPVVSPSDGLQSINGCASPALSMQLLVPWSLAFWTVYNHLRDNFVLHWIPNCWYGS